MKASSDMAPSLTAQTNLLVGRPLCSEELSRLLLLELSQRRVVGVADRTGRVERRAVWFVQLCAENQPIDQVGVGQERPADRDCTDGTPLREALQLAEVGVGAPAGVEHERPRP